METSVQQPVGLNLNILGIPWRHHVVLLDRAKSMDEAFFYLQQTIENNWSQVIFTLQVEQDLYKRRKKPSTIFIKHCPKNKH